MVAQAIMVLDRASVKHSREGSTGLPLLLNLHRQQMLMYSRKTINLRNRASASESKALSIRTAPGLVFLAFCDSLSEGVNRRPYILTSHRESVLKLFMQKTVNIFPVVGPCKPKPNFRKICKHQSEVVSVVAKAR